MALFFISLLAGLLTVLSPCVLPLLPVIVGGSVAGELKLRRAVTVTASLALSVFLFTLLLKVSTLFINVPATFWSYVSGGLVILVGLATLFPQIWDGLGFMARANRDSNKLMSAGFMQQNFWGDVLVGAALGPVFSTCSPTYFIVLASVLPVSLAAGLADIIAYIAGLSISLLIISVVGQRIMHGLGIAADPNGWFKKVLGILFILIGIAIISGFDKVIEAPLYSVFDETVVEQHLLQSNTGSDGAPAPLTPYAAPGGAATTTPMPNSLTLAEKQARYHLAPELVSPDAYLNTGGQPISLAQYRGKNVVLLDFWTYSCINCLRTLPYLTAWYGKYKDEGLVVIGVHTPEFAFEHVESNVAAALKQYGIAYPVVLDNEYQTWNAYQNQYWPHEYVIDIDGFITHDHAGEGEYDQTEAAIQAALRERAGRLGMDDAAIASTTTPIAPTEPTRVGSPETYFGSNRNQFLGNGNRGVSGTQSFTPPLAPELNVLYLGGTWDIEPEYAATTDDAETIEYEYNSQDLYFVASADSPVQVEVIQDGAPVGSAAGADVNSTTSMMTIGANRLYKVVHNPAPGYNLIEIKLKSAGLKAYTFTFG